MNLHLTDSIELHTTSRVDDTGRPFAEIAWGVHGPLPASYGTGALWGTTTAMRRLAELILEAAQLAEEEAAWQAHTSASPTLEGSVV